MNHFTKLMGSISVLALFAATPAIAEELDFAGALTGQYAHIDPSSAFVDNINVWGVGVSGAFGIMDSVNLQLDGSYNTVDTDFGDSDVWNFGGSLFWAGSEGRLGVNVNYALLDDVGGKADAFNYGVFGDYYVDDMFTVGIRGGGFAGDFDGFFVGGGVTGYIDPDFALNGSIDYIKIDSALSTTNYSITGEFLVSQDFPAALFAGYTHSRYSAGAGNANTFFVGVKFFMGNSGSSLVEHHRNGVAPVLGLNAKNIY